VVLPVQARSASAWLVLYRGCSTTDGQLPARRAYPRNMLSTKESEMVSQQNRVAGPDATQTATSPEDGSSLTRTEAPSGDQWPHPADSALCDPQINGDERTPVAVEYNPGRTKRRSRTSLSRRSVRVAGRQRRATPGGRGLAPLWYVFGGLALAGPSDRLSANLTQAETDRWRVAPQGTAVGDGRRTGAGGIPCLFALDKGHVG